MASPFLSRVPLSNTTSNFTSISFSFSLSTSLPYLPSSTFPSKHPWQRILTVRSKIREIFMPALSSTMTEGKIVSWIKSEGNKLSKGKSVVVVESDKANMDVETFYDGILPSWVFAVGFGS
jgi:pyruvate dehydrogenase E2 component (dihydrolipoamide acetyltransferase)